MRTLLYILVGSLALSCYAEPTQEDLERVKRRFLLLRFEAPLSAEYRGKSDAELFQVSCRQNRVRCDDVLELLREHDRKFHDRLMEGEKP